MKTIKPTKPVNISRPPSAVDTSACGQSKKRAVPRMELYPPIGRSGGIKTREGKIILIGIITPKRGREWKGGLLSPFPFILGFGPPRDIRARYLL
jgi:hypothetical protein